MVEQKNLLKSSYILKAVRSQGKCIILLQINYILQQSTSPAVPSLFGTRDRFRGRQFFHGWRWGGGMIQSVMQAMGSDGEWLMKLYSLTHCSPPAVCPRGWGPLN